MSETTLAGAGATSRPTVLSRATTIQIGGLLGITAVFHALNLIAYSSELSDVAYNAIYIMGIALPMLAAVAIIRVAVSIGIGESIGRQWLMIGLGTAAFALGDIAWMIIELFMGLEPYPSIADLFYPLQYAFFFTAILIAILGYRGLFDLRTPVLAGVGTAAVGTAIVYVTLLQPYIFASGVEELGLAGLVVSTLYPVGDVVFMLAPAVTLALVISRLGAGRFAWPWWIVVLAASVFAVTDSVYAYADWSGMGTTAWMDLGWIGAQMLFATAALVARDVYRS